MAAAAGSTVHKTGRKDQADFEEASRQERASWPSMGPAAETEDEVLCGSTLMHRRCVSVHGRGEARRGEASRCRDVGVYWNATLVNLAARTRRRRNRQKEWLRVRSSIGRRSRRYVVAKMKSSEPAVVLSRGNRADGFHPCPLFGNSAQQRVWQREPPPLAAIGCCDVCDPDGAVRLSKGCMLQVYILCVGTCPPKKDG